MKFFKKYFLDFLVVAILIAIGAVMFVIGRGHTIYFDNKSLSVDGTDYAALYQIEVFVNDEKVAKLKEGDRGMVSTMGQKFEMILHLKADKDAKKTGAAISLEIPYSMDGVILNLPALIGGASQEAYMTEFIPTPVEPTEEDEVVVTDEFAIGEE